MFQVAEFFKSALRVLVAAGFIAAGLVALFVAWWIAVAAVLGFAVYVAVRRMLPRKPPHEPQRGSGCRPAVIDGEYRIEREDPPHLGER